MLLESITPISFQVIVGISNYINILNYLQQKDVHDNNQDGQLSNTVPQWVQVLRTIILFNKERNKFL